MDDPRGHFTAEHPWVTDSAASYSGRLARTLAPLPAMAERPDVVSEAGSARKAGEADSVGRADSEMSARYRPRAQWLEPLVESTRTTAPEDPAATFGFLSRGGQDGLTAAVLVVREVTGPRDLGLADALARILSHEGSRRYRRDHPRHAAGPPASCADPLPEPGPGQPTR